MPDALADDLGAELEAAHSQIDLAKSPGPQDFEAALAVLDPLPRRGERDDIADGVEEAADDGNAVASPETVGEDNVRTIIKNMINDLGGRLHPDTFAEITVDINESVHVHNLYAEVKDTFGHIATLLNKEK